jgi:hypothetical protein
MVFHRQVCQVVCLGCPACLECHHLPSWGAEAVSSSSTFIYSKTANLHQPPIFPRIYRSHHQIWPDLDRQAREDPCHRTFRFPLRTWPVDLLHTCLSRSLHQVKLDHLPWVCRLSRPQEVCHLADSRPLSPITGHLDRLVVRYRQLRQVYSRVCTSIQFSQRSIESLRGRDSTSWNLRNTLGVARHKGCFHTERPKTLRFISFNTLRTQCIKSGT